MTGSSDSANVSARTPDRGSISSHLAVTTLSALITWGAASQALGQTGGETDGSRPFAVSPTLRLTDVGWDDNVFRVSSADKPVGDFTAILNPGAQASLRIARLQVSGRSQLAFVYFKQLSDLRAIDVDTGARTELALGLLRPYLSGDWANTRHRRNLEIDLPVRRTDFSWTAGVDLLLSGKTSLGVMTRRSRVDYEGETIYLNTDLAHYLGATAAIYGVRFRYSVTPLTTVGVDIERDENEFAAATERNADGFRMMSVIEFQPIAPVTGRAQIGVRTRSFLDGDAPPFRGAVARVDLGYTLLGRTQFAVSVQRDLSYSYRADERDYLQTGVELSATYRLANAWDVTGTVGRFVLEYGLAGPAALRAAQAEQVVSYALGVGYHLDRARVGLQFARQTRESDFSPFRGFDGTRIGTSLTYGF
jgi:hypothetical protein